MKVLLCHNFYQQPGGEDVCFHQEAELLEARGHTVMKYTRHNDDIHKMSAFSLARQTLWSKRTYVEIRGLIELHQPDVMHCTNTFPLISPAVYSAARDGGVPVVQALHNYRLLCPKATFLRDGSVCEKCLGKSFAWPGIWHACYRESRSASGMVALLLASQRLRKTWLRQVDVFYALTQFAKEKFIEGGLPAARMRIKPNFITPDPGFAAGEGQYAAFVGRLSTEKGIATLLEAWSKISAPVQLKIIGDGPLADDVAAAAKADPRIEWVGRKSGEEVLRLVGDASCLLLPSLWYEGFPRTIVESFSRGTPVIASRLGSMTEVIEEGRTGKLVKPGDADDLAEKVTAFFLDQTQHAPMRRAAYGEFTSKYSAEENYQILIDIYRQAIRERRAEQRAGTIDHTHAKSEPLPPVAASSK